MPYSFVSLLAKLRAVFLSRHYSIIVSFMSSLLPSFLLPSFSPLCLPRTSAVWTEYVSKSGAAAAAGGKDEMCSQIQQTADEVAPNTPLPSHKLAEYCDKLQPCLQFIGMHCSLLFSDVYWSTLGRRALFCWDFFIF